MNRLALLVVFAACDAGVAPTKPEPTKLVVEAPPPPPSDASVTVPADAAGPTPPLAVRLRIRNKDESSVAECNRNTLTFSLVDKSKNIVDTRTETSTCSGACDAQAKRDGAAQVDALEEALRKDPDMTPSVLDYDFTGCLAAGLHEYRTVRVAGRDIAILLDDYVGPHTHVDHALRLALEVCGKVFIGEQFAEYPPSYWGLDNVVVAKDGDAAIVVNSTDEKRGTLYRLRFPACPATPSEESFDVMPY